MADSEVIRDPWLNYRIGGVAQREFNNASDYHKHDLLEWINNLPLLTDDELRQEAGMAIHASALVQRFRGNWEHEHCKASVCYHESQRRKVDAGHAEDCRVPTVYELAFNDVMIGQGYKPNQLGRCGCEKGGPS